MVPQFFITILFVVLQFSWKIDHLKEGFLNPPDSSRPGVYWYFMDGNLDREAMTKDLEIDEKSRNRLCAFPRS